MRKQSEWLEDKVEVVLDEVMKKVRDGIIKGFLHADDLCFLVTGGRRGEKVRPPGERKL